MSVSLVKAPAPLSLRKAPIVAPIKGNGGYPAWMGRKASR